MLKGLLSRIAGLDPRNEGTALAVAGMAGLLSGQKLASLAAFGRGVWKLEQAWRQANPDFDGDLADRWQAAVAFYEETHQDRTNRVLHVVGIPMIVGGAAGLLLCGAGGPLWWASAGSFTLGWALNIAGHGIFEKKAPAFADDPLAFIAGPVWDVQQLLRSRGAKLQAVGAGRAAA
jgi:hypothetical protein